MMSLKSWHGGGNRGQSNLSPFNRYLVKRSLTILAAVLVMTATLLVPQPTLSVAHRIPLNYQLASVSASGKKTSGGKVLGETNKLDLSTKATLGSAISLPSAQPGQAMGIAAGSYLSGMNSSSLNAAMNGIAATGAKWVRFDFDWSQIQPDNSSSFNWSTTDAVVAAATAKHLSILGIIDYTPAWARPANCNADSKCGPASAAQYAQFASTVATRYISTVHAWEIWNEPNNQGFWQPTPNPRDYTSLLKAAYPAIHAVSSNETVLSAGLSPAATTSSSYSPYDFLKGVYDNGGKQFFDAVADHPYTFPLTPLSNADDAWTQMAGPGNSLRSLMVANGDAAKKIWITEFGSPTGGPGPVATLANPNLAAHPYVVDNALQAQILQDALTQYRSYSWAGPFFYYTYQDSGTDQTTNENFFGLINYYGSPKPAYGVFKAAATSD